MVVVIFDFASTTRVIGLEDRTLHQLNDWLGRLSFKLPIIMFQWDGTRYHTMTFHSNYSRMERKECKTQCGRLSDNHVAAISRVNCIITVLHAAEAQARSQPADDGGGSFLSVRTFFRVWDWSSQQG